LFIYLDGECKKDCDDYSYESSNNDGQLICEECEAPCEKCYDKDRCETCVDEG